MININKVELAEKEQNILNVLNAVLGSNGISPGDIAQQTGLSASTISRVLAILKKKKLIVSIGKETTDKGRRPDLVNFNVKYGQLAHLDVMHDCVVGYIAALDGQPYHSERIPIEKDRLTLELLLDSIGGVYNRLIQKGASKKRKVLAASISVPGVVNEAERVVQRIPDVFPFSDIDVFDYAERVLHVPVIINNAARLAAVGQQIGSFPQSENLVYININSIGIGAGVIINGKLIKGAQYAAGEIGDLYFDRKNFFGDCENSLGRLEEYAGLEALFCRLRQCIYDGGAKALQSLLEQQGSELLNLSLIESAIDQGDEDVRELYSDVLKVWAIAIINIHLLINPDCVVIGGAISPEHEKTIDILNSLVSRALHFQPRLYVNQLADRALLLGGMEVLRQYVYNQIIAAEATKSL